MFNALEYLYVSTNVAKAFPDLFESALIRLHRNYLPGNMALNWKQGSQSYLLLLLSTIPINVQKLVGRIILPLGIATVTFGLAKRVQWSFPLYILLQLGALVVIVIPISQIFLNRLRR